VFGRIPTKSRKKREEVWYEKKEYFCKKITGKKGSKEGSYFFYVKIWCFCILKTRTLQ
jgi:hypothetical protein